MWREKGVFLGGIMLILKQFLDIGLRPWSHITFVALVSIFLFLRDIAKVQWLKLSSGWLCRAAWHLHWIQSEKKSPQLHSIPWVTFSWSMQLSAIGNESKTLQNVICLSGFFPALIPVFKSKTWFEYRDVGSQFAEGKQCSGLCSGLWSFFSSLYWGWSQY